ncbi:hypothetical protein BO70DRAFT_76866 [Aspergillus heteromorphus CBS 117.55]|uniref:COMPASS complex subunit Sdc1 n=1 Tax=Aspergillus heteromorphus CBS 117.55 TaxID=1448321 RepID=A0A317WZI2_9EURO|nr:uncharacterized protein BO70DRAFT_76866 [Aspergillus heteromorphus CBS 117.55]PWY90732.1 hypothetical protein BO70DRAFT_76866 [Aspergillus heteromorphus CBS 117.55]
MADHPSPAIAIASATQDTPTPNPPFNPPPQKQPPPPPQPTQLQPHPQSQDRTRDSSHEKTMPQDSAANTPTADSNAAGTPTATFPTTTNNTPGLVRPGGAPARVYMNEKIVPYLLEGMKSVTKEQPPNPLRVLGEFLIQKSNEIEQQQPGTTKTPE